MVRRDIQTALIVAGDSDMELDIKVRLASALEGTSPHLIDLLVVGRTLPDPAEPEARDMLALLRQADGASDLSAQMQRRWAKREFLRRSAILFPSPAPRGVHAYALNARMARRLHQRMSQQAISDSPSLDSLLADAVADGQCTAYSVSPPLIVARASQFLRRSVRHAIGARDDDPAQYPPFVDWQELWT
ncbi:hypothetical protein IWQ56_005039 [Coemansia nantahalensis]|nr:hypothetical protein IWQ56_005039 [Coemansia nantahalensis]